MVQNNLIMLKQKSKKAAFDLVYYGLNADFVGFMQVNYNFHEFCSALFNYLLYNQ